MGTRDWDPGWLKEIIADALSERVMPIPRCDTCKWWDGQLFGDCDSPLRPCDFRPPPDFGCVQWESKR